MSMLAQFLREPSAATHYAVLDAAVLDGLLFQLHALGAKQYACLLAGEVEPDVAHVAPYLARLDATSPLLPWLEQRLDLPWGYLVESPLALDLLQRRLRCFSEVRNGDGEPLLFRFWDPRVLREMRSILTPAQSTEFTRGVLRLCIVDAHAGVTGISWQERLQQWSCSSGLADTRREVQA